MASPGTQQGIIRFGPFELDPANRELRKCGIVVKLQPQQFAVLLMLTQRAGQIVSRDEIHQHIWGTDTFVDFERGINFSINQIRAALGDDAAKPRFIQTIPRHGYRFVGALEPEPIPQQSDAPALEQTTSHKNRIWRLVFALAAAFVLACLILASLSNWRPWSARKTAITNGRRTVAVIQIENHSQDPSLNWLGDGLVDLLTTDLAQAKNLDVISTERVRDLISGKTKPDQSLPPNEAEEIARKAGADVFVSGGILRMDKGFRLDLRVQDSGSGKVLLSEKVEGDSPQAIFSMVDETTNRILAKFSPGEDVVRPRPVTLTSNFNALRAYEEGISYTRRWVRPQKAAASFRRAIEFDPQFVMAYFRLANQLPGYRESHEALARASLLAERPGLPEQQKLFIRARLLVLDGRSEEAIPIFREIVRRYPRELLPRLWLADKLPIQGHFREATSVLEEATKLDDSEQNIIWNQLAYTYGLQGEVSQALNAVDRMAALQPLNDPNPIDTRADIYAMGGYLDKALAEYKRNLESHPEFSFTGAKIALVYLLAGKNREAVEAAKVADQKESGIGRAYAANVQGDVSLGSGNLALASKYFEQSARIFGTDRSDLSRWESWKSAEVYFEQGQPRLALALANRLPGFSAAEIRGVAYLLLNNDAAAEKEFVTARNDMVPYFSDYQIDQFIAFDRLRAASYSHQWPRVIAGWTKLGGEIKVPNEFFPGRAYTELSIYPRAEADLRAGLRWVNPGNLVGSYSDFFWYELTQFYLGKVFEKEGKKTEAINSYRTFLSHFDHSTARLPQISEARGAIQRLR
jgi:DNA-binding winged helix-turn-helix (wHTH) protein/tetratricopeptide (TPR) repeat protein/TolB-like protein